MLRVSFLQSSGDAVGASRTDAELGASVGISFASELGVGFDLAFDYLNVGGRTSYELSAGKSYISGS